MLLHPAKSQLSLTSSQKCQGVPFSPIRQNALLLQRPHESWPHLSATSKSQLSLTKEPRICCAHIHIHIQIQIHIHIHIHIHKHIHAHIHTYTGSFPVLMSECANACTVRSAVPATLTYTTCMHLYVYIYVYVICIYVYIYLSLYSYIYMYIYIYICTHIHIYTYTYLQSEVFQIPEPLLTYTSTCSLTIKHSQGLGTFFQLKRLTTGRAVPFN